MEEEWVYLKLQSNRQWSLANRPFQKLVARFYGPFLITQKMGKVAYKLQLPDTAKIHPVFHVSQLKKAIGSQIANPTLLAHMTEDLKLYWTPESVSGVRVNSGEQG